MKGKLRKDISANTLQVVCNQALGLLIFLITSRYLDKAIYGELNWSLAILTFITTLLSLRLEQIVVRKVAAGDDPSKMLTLFFGHIVFSGLMFYLILLVGSFLFPSFFNQHSLLLVLAISQLLSFFSTPFKQLATGKENFGLLAVMSSVANLVRSVWLVCVVIFSSLDIQQVLLIYIISSLAELLLCGYLVKNRLHISISLQWTLKDYYGLIHESFPQIGVVFLNACIARIDWILLGIFSTQVVTAEYSFAYKVFELSPVPMLIIGPVLLTRFSAYFSKHTEATLAAKQHELGFLIRIEMVLATLLPLILNVVWTPLMDGLTHGKYGAVNKTTFLLLSVCVPLQYLINLFWTVHFAQNHLSLILRITAITCAMIVVGDLLMIPLLNAKGAAIAYLLAMIVECLLYFKHSAFVSIRDKWVPLSICTGIAFISGFAVYRIDLFIIGKLVLSVLIYGVLLLLTKQIRKDDIRLLKNWLAGKEIKFQTE